MYLSKKGSEIELLQSLQHEETNVMKQDDPEVKEAVNQASCCTTDRFQCDKPED